MEPSGPLTLLDLMKARGVLSPAEALQIATPLAQEVDANPEGSVILTKQSVSIVVSDGQNGKQERSFLHAPLSEWPSFRVQVEKLSEAEQRALPVPSGKDTTLSGQTIVPGLNNSGGSIGALASLIYEMVGGTPSRRYVPVARLTETQNMVLQRAMASGAILYTQAADLLAKLRQEALDSRVTPAPAPTPAGPSTAPPLPNPSSLPQKIQSILPAASPDAPSAGGFKGFLATREGRQMALAGAGAVALVLVIGIVLLFSGHSSSESSKPTTPPAGPTTPVVQAPNNPTPPPAGGNDAKTLADLIQRIKNNPGGIPTPQPPAQDGANNAAQSVRFTIGKQLTQGGFSEKILISVAQNGRPVIPTQTLMVTPNSGFGSIAITVPGSGPYVISAAATSSTNYGLYMGRGATAPVQVHNGETIRMSFENINQMAHSFTINFSN